MGTKPAERKRIAVEVDMLQKRLPELKVEYGRLLRRDELAWADEVRGEALEVFNSIQALERMQFEDSLDLIGLYSTERGMAIAEKLLEYALRPSVDGRAYETVSADGSVCVVVHEGVVPVRRFPSDRMESARNARRGGL